MRSSAAGAMRRVLLRQGDGSQHHGCKQRQRDDESAATPEEGLTVLVIERLGHRQRETRPGYRSQLPPRRQAQFTRCHRCERRPPSAAQLGHVEPLTRQDRSAGLRAISDDDLTRTKRQRHCDIAIRSEQHDVTTRQSCDESSGAEVTEVVFEQAREHAGQTGGAVAISESDPGVGKAPAVRSRGNDDHTCRHHVSMPRSSAITCSAL